MIRSAATPTSATVDHNWPTMSSDHPKHEFVSDPEEDDAFERTASGEPFHIGKQTSTAPDSICRLAHLHQRGVIFAGGFFSDCSEEGDADLQEQEWADRLTSSGRVRGGGIAGAIHPLD